MDDDFPAPSWLTNLKPGDTVIISWTIAKYRIPLIKKVKSVGKKLIALVDYDKRFNKTSGDETGSDWDKGSLKEATPEAIAQIQEQKEKQEVVARLAKINFEKLPLSVLKEIEGAIAQVYGGHNE